MMSRPEIKQIIYKGIAYKLIPTEIKPPCKIAYTCIIYHPFTNGEPIYNRVISKAAYRKTTVFDGVLAPNLMWGEAKNWEHFTCKEAEAFIDVLVEGMTDKIGELGNRRREDETAPKTYRNLKFMHRDTALSILNDPEMLEFYRFS